MPPSINLIAFFEQVAISCFFFRLFVCYIFKKTKRYKAKEKKKELLWVNIRSVGNFLLILRDTLLGKTRSEVGNMCISSWFQLARWSTINWQQIGNVINPIIKFSKLVFASEMSCKLPWSIWRVTRKSNRLSKPPRKFTWSVLPFVGKIMVVLFSSLFTCWTDD